MEDYHMLTLFPEAYADPRMQEMFQDEQRWGLPLPTFDIFMRHSVQGRRRIISSLGLGPGEHPFSWGGSVMHNAASAALLILRNKKNPTDTEYAQLCWLEMSLMEEVSFLEDGAHLGRFADLVNERQIKFLKEWDMRAQKEYSYLEGDKDDNLAPAIETVEMSDEELEQEIKQFFEPSQFEVEDNKKRQRVLTYLKTIK